MSNRPFQLRLFWGTILFMKNTVAAPMPVKCGSITPGDLEKLHVFRRVSPEAVMGLLDSCPVKRLEEGEVLLQRGDTNQRMFVVVSGRLAIHIDRVDSEPVAYLEQGQTVGELSVIGDSPASAFVVASAPTRLLTIDEDTFWRLVQSSHAFATNLLLLLAQRMTASNTTIEEAVTRRRELELEVNADALTGLHNRRWLDRNLARLVKRHRFGKMPMSLLMIDIDHFKRFNDDHGHMAGDVVLAGVASTLGHNLRPTDMAARYGGEEFTVILPSTALPGALVAAERLRDSVKGSSFRCLGGKELPTVTISIGVAELVEDEEAGGLIERADAALYRAKNNGRDRVES